MGTKCSWGSWVYCCWDVAQSLYLTLSRFQGSRDQPGGMNNWFPMSALQYGIEFDRKDSNPVHHQVQISGESIFSSFLLKTQVHTSLFEKEHEENIPFEQTEAAVCSCEWLSLAEVAANQPRQLIAKGQEGSFLADVGL